MCKHTRINTGEVAGDALPWVYFGVGRVRKSIPVWSLDDYTAVAPPPKPYSSYSGPYIPGLDRILGPLWEEALQPD